MPTHSGEFDVLCLKKKCNVKMIAYHIHRVCSKLHNNGYLHIIDILIKQIR